MLFRSVTVNGLNEISRGSLKIKDGDDMVVNEELRFDIWNPVAGLVFFDLGNVWEDTAQFDSSLFKSIGVGLRADTPIGLLRLDWAFPLDRREGDSSSKVYFGFGNTF